MAFFVSWCRYETTRSLCCCPGRDTMHGRHVSDGTLNQWKSARSKDQLKMFLYRRHGYGILQSARAVADGTLTAVSVCVWFHLMSVCRCVSIAAVCLRPAALLMLVLKWSTWQWMTSVMTSLLLVIL